jgi:hypothetical protein
MICHGNRGDLGKINHFCEGRLCGGVFEVMLLGPSSALLYELRCVSFDRVNSGVRMSGRAIEPRFIQIELPVRHAPNQNRSDLLVSECRLVLDVKVKS